MDLQNILFLDRVSRRCIKRRWLDSAVRALGLSRRMITCYEQGKKPIPRVVAGDQGATVIYC